MPDTRRNITLHEMFTQLTVGRVSNILHTAPSEYEAAKQITTEYLGARRFDGTCALFGFWVPGMVDGDLQGKTAQLSLELFTPLEPIDFTALRKDEVLAVEFQRDTLNLAAVDNYLVGVVENARFGTRDQAGSFYWLRYEDQGRRYILRDPLLYSCPFGIYAPAELFDIQAMLAGRRDMDYFRSFYKTIFPDGTYRANDVGMHLEIHPETATDEGTLAALTRRYHEIGRKIRANMEAGREDVYADLSPADRNFIGFDSIELTPEVPPAEREAVTCETGEFFQIAGDEQAATVTANLKRPDISNWGYDTPILGSAAINPSILATLRPNEFLEFIETIHTMPDRPIQLCIDSVLGHCDFQGARLLETFDAPSADRANPKYTNSKYLRGPNMYGRDIDFADPNVKAVLLELLVRKLNFGYDCVRVDGAQDFIIEMDEETGLRIQDDEFLNEMSNVVQEINGLRRRLDFNLEDGRPWPDDLNWLYNSKYLDHCIERTLPFGDRVKQWSPIIFAHNVHGKYKWFLKKWDRFVEVFRYGENWITGHSNHDNARYFYRMVKLKPSSAYRPGDSFDEYYNDQLGAALPEIAHHAMDNNALTALMLGFLPGNPMFLLNALFHTPWLFLRDIDDRYDVKIVADEGARFFTWYIDEALYAQPDNFARLKALGFRHYRQLVAEPAQKAVQPAFLDVLFEHCQRIKTDALMVRFLFDDPDDAGGYQNLDELESAYQRIVQPGTAEDQRHAERLQQRIDADPRESARRVKAARVFMRKNLRFLRRDQAHTPDGQLGRMLSQIEKLEFLQRLDDSKLALLIEDADLRGEYNVATWAADERLTALAPEAMRSDRCLTPERLKIFAKAFMLDARDAAKVPQYETRVDPQQVQCNFALRLFRRRNPWLLRNPTNDVQKDYVARKLFINGAKEVGDWGDQGDIVKCNTIYYGWRTSPDNTRQVFLIANMEGNPIDRCPLKLFLNLSGAWDVVTHSPSMQGIPAQMDKHFIIEDFRNGQALLLERRLT
jgi:hypothetical protein